MEVVRLYSHLTKKEAYKLQYEVYSYWHRINADLSMEIAKVFKERGTYDTCDRLFDCIREQAWIAYSIMN